MSNAPSEDEIRKWHRWFAVECNNRAWRLSELETRSATEDAEMLRAAHAAALHWGAVGTAVHAARAEMLLGHVYALLGQGQPAVRYARSSFDYVMSHDSPDWEHPFAHAILAHAALAAGDAETHARHHAIAKQLGEAQTSAEDRAIFDATFRRIPRP